jgi:hypothetical protein
VSEAVPFGPTPIVRLIRTFHCLPPRPRGPLGLWKSAMTGGPDPGGQRHRRHRTATVNLVDVDTVTRSSRSRRPLSAQRAARQRAGTGTHLPRRLDPFALRGQPKTHCGVTADVSDVRGAPHVRRDPV